jgi:hypothetical protein
MTKTKITGKDDIEINGKIYYIPDKYTDFLNIIYGFEQKKLYKYILSKIIEHYLESALTLELLNKNHMDKYIFICDKIFSYVITGKLNINTFSLWENKIINNIPNTYIPKLNPKVVERLE